MSRYLLVSMVLIAAACTSPPARDPAVVEDVLQYVTRIKKWEKVESEALKAIADVKRSQYVDDEYVVATLGGAMDDIQLHLAEIGQYQPATPAVTEVHDRYRKAWQDLHDAFQDVIDAMKRKDYVALSKGTEELKTSREELLMVAAALSILMEDSGLKDAEGGQRPAASCPWPIPFRRRIPWRRLPR
jgi:hypothetical protein